jgi:DNA replication protein DnaC
MSVPAELRLAVIRQHCKQLHLPAVGSQCARLATEASSAQQDHLTYLEALLGAELEERTHRLVERRIREAHFPVLKTLEQFRFAEAPTIPAATLRLLAEGAYLAAAEPVLFLGEPGTGKTHLAIGLGVAACRQRRRVRFTTAAALVNDLLEAQHQHQLSRVLNRWARVELIVIDELAYVAVADLGAELLFQLIAERAEKATVIATTNLPFSEWTTVFPNARLCKALLDRLTDRAHIIDTGTESYRFRRSLEQRQGKGRLKPRTPSAAKEGGSPPPATDR